MGSQVVGACGGRVGREGVGELGDVRRLVRRDLLEAVADPGGVAGGMEVAVGELGEALGEERALRLLDLQEVLRDAQVCGRVLSSVSCNAGERGEAGLTVPVAGPEDRDSTGECEEDCLAEHGGDM